jgi:hypothetical protein
MGRLRAFLAWLSPPLDPDDDDLLPRPDPPVMDPYVRLAAASSALKAAENEWARAVAGLAARRVDR